MSSRSSPLLALSHSVGSRGVIVTLRDVGLPEPWTACKGMVGPQVVARLCVDCVEVLWRFYGVAHCASLGEGLANKYLRNPPAPCTLRRMSTKKAPSLKPVSDDAPANVPRVALTLKITKPDYIRLTKLRVKWLEAGRDVSHQDILYDALRNHLHKHGV
jgi:hypothetical protein